MKSNAAKPYAILGDIHSNLGALQRTLADLERRGLSNIAVLGDNGGRGLQTDQCLDLVRTRASIAVYGNWEVATHAHLSAENQAFVDSLPLMAFLGESVLVHASPICCDYCDSARSFKEFLSHSSAGFWPSRFDYFPYLSGKVAVAAAAERLRDLGKKLVLHGHTHKQQVWASRSRGELVRILPDAISLASSEAEAVYMIGVGSVGQAQAGLAQYAIYDVDERTVEFVTLA